MTDLLNILTNSEGRTASQYRVGPVWIDRVEYWSNGVDFIDTRAYINVKLFGAKGDGVTDDSASVLLAKAEALNHGNAVIFFPISSGDYVLSKITIDADDITIDARYATLRNSSSGDPLFIISTVKNLNINIKGIDSFLGAGPTFDIIGNLFNSKIYVDQLIHKEETSQIINSDYTINTATSMYFTEIRGLEWYHPLSSTTPAIVMSGNINSHSSNTIDIVRYETNTNSVRPVSPFIEIRCDGPSYQYGNKITGSVEKCVAGFAHLYSCYNTSIENITFYDLTKNGFNISAPLIKLDRGIALRRTENTSIKNIVKTSGVQDAGIYDIDQTQGQRTNMESISAVTGTMKINFAGLSAIATNIDDAEIFNAGRTTLTGEVSKYYEHTIATLPVGSLGYKAFITDEVGGPTEVIHNGANWLRVRDNVVVS